MISLQDGVRQIFSDSPQNLYFFTGLEYGVKCEYLNILASKFENRIENHSSLLELVESFKQKSLIPRPKSIFIVRYDREFTSKLNSDISSQFQTLNIPGIIVGIYQEDKDEDKLDKFFPNNVLRINLLTPEMCNKHLISKFPNIPEMFISYAVEFSSDFYQAELICNSMAALGVNRLSSMSKSELENLFEYKPKSTSERFREIVASRNTKLMLEFLDCFDGDKNLLLYDALNAYLELIKCLEKKYVDSYAKPYINRWTVSDVTHMFGEGYNQLEMMRNYSNYDIDISLSYLAIIMQYKLG